MVVQAKSPYQAWKVFDSVVDEDSDHAKDYAKNNFEALVCTRVRG